MVFNAKNISVLAYANGFTLWHYKTDDDVADVTGDGYFNDSHRMLRVGDIIITNAVADNLETAKILLVRQVEQGGAVGVSAIS